MESGSGYRLDGAGFVESVTPVARYSRLDPDFEGPSLYPSPSIWWDWEKLDYGILLQLPRNSELVVEYPDNSFQRNSRNEENNELLVTLRLAFSPSRK